MNKVKVLIVITTLLLLAGCPNIECPLDKEDIGLGQCVDK